MRRRGNKEIFSSTVLRTLAEVKKRKGTNQFTGSSLCYIKFLLLSAFALCISKYEKTFASFLIFINVKWRREGDNEQFWTKILCFKPTDHVDSRQRAWQSFICKRFSVWLVSSKYGSYQKWVSARFYRGYKIQRPHEILVLLRLFVLH